MFCFYIAVYCNGVGDTKEQFYFNVENKPVKKHIQYVKKRKNIQFNSKEKTVFY
jgi:hypothetical protein